MEQLNKYGLNPITFSITVGTAITDDGLFIQHGYYKGKFGSIPPNIAVNINPDTYGIKYFYYNLGVNQDHHLYLTPFVLSCPFFSQFGIKALIITFEGKDYEANYRIETNQYEGSEELIFFYEEGTYDITIRPVLDEPDEPEPTQYSTSTDMNGSIFIYYTKSIDLDGNIIIYKPKAKSYTFIC